MTSTQLRKTFKAIHPQLSQHHATRLHRALSWMDAAQQKETSEDMRFIAWWISFNACYAIHQEAETPLPERALFMKFLERLHELDEHQAIYGMLWNKFAGPVRLLIENRFVYRPFWEAHHGKEMHWESLHRKSIEQALTFLSARDVPNLLAIVLDRLYTLRNQLMHGGATFKSRVNRKQLRDGVRILESLVPLILQVMMNHPEEDWGLVMYPHIPE
jgi:hypothetical protein